jgi:hypothetical protein
MVARALPLAKDEITGPDRIAIRQRDQSGIGQGQHECGKACAGPITWQH